MKIGLDMDEVLAQFLATFIIYHNDKYNTNHRLEDIDEFELWKVWGGKKGEIGERIKQFIKDGGVSSLSPVPNAQKIIMELKKDHELFVITARHDSGRLLTEKWLEEHYPEAFMDVHFSNDSHKDNESQKSKADICTELGIDIMVEDSYEFAHTIASVNIPVLLLDYSWNRNKPPTHNIYRVYSWNDIPRKINSIHNV
ncbi:MAG: 5' nucleotidase, NT5C type [Candidatus Woesearchaeota archaeon]